MLWPLPCGILFHSTHPSEVGCISACLLKDLQIVVLPLSHGEPAIGQVMVVILLSWFFLFYLFKYFMVFTVFIYCMFPRVTFCRMSGYIHLLNK